MPRLSAIGFAPAETFFRPSRTIAWASTVAVVVPSPATSFVAVATSRTSCAPWFSNDVLDLDLTGDRDAVVRDRRRAVLLVEHDVAPLRAKGDLDRVGEDVDAALERAARVLAELQFLVSHLSLSSSFL